MRRLALGAPIVLILFSASPTQSLRLMTTVAAQAPSSQGAQPREQSPSTMQDMMKMHEQMMAEMKAADSRLDALVKEMKAASGDAQVKAITALVTELVRQQKAMHEHMGQMDQQMMGGRGMMMKK
jgi:hypothetical protein